MHGGTVDRRRDLRYDDATRPRCEGDRSFLADQCKIRVVDREIDGLSVPCRRRRFPLGEQKRQAEYQERDGNDERLPAWLVILLSVVGLIML